MELVALGMDQGKREWRAPGSRAHVRVVAEALGGSGSRWSRGSVQRGLSSRSGGDPGCWKLASWRETDRESTEMRNPANQTSRSTDEWVIEAQAMIGVSIRGSHGFTVSAVLPFYQLSASSC